MKVLLCNGCANETKSIEANYLLTEKKEIIMEGLQKVKDTLKADEIWLVYPKDAVVEGIKVDRLIAFGVMPILTNEIALIEMLQGKLPRPGKRKGKLQYEGNELEVISLTQAYQEGLGGNAPSIPWYVTVNQGSGQIVVEVSEGMSIKDVLSDAQVPVDNIKAILLGGIIGEIIPTSEIEDIKLKNVIHQKSITLFNKDQCLVKESKELFKEVHTNSCGKCVLCREGSLQFRSFFEEIDNGKGKMKNLELMEEVATLIEVGAYCDYGKRMAVLLQSVVKEFNNEFKEHIVMRKCVAGICNAYDAYVILPKVCTGCEGCVDECPEDAIVGKKKFIHMIDEDLCTGCGKCIQACDEEAIIVVSGTKPKLPKKLTKVGRFK